MRVAWVACLAPLVGCQVVFPLEELETGRRATFTATVTDDDKLEFTLPDDVVAGDQIIGVIQAGHFDTEIVEQDGWDVIDDYPDGNCADPSEWHAFIMGLEVADQRTFRFRFQIARFPDTIDALFVPYVAAGTVRYLGAMAPADMDQASEISLGVASAANGARVFVSDVGDKQAAQDPAGMERIDSFASIAAFDQPVGEMVPAIVVPVPAMRCVGVSELVLEP